MEREDGVACERQPLVVETRRADREQVVIFLNLAGGSVVMPCGPGE